MWKTIQKMRKKGFPVYSTFLLCFMIMTVLLSALFSLQALRNIQTHLGNRIPVAAIIEQNGEMINRHYQETGEFPSNIESLSVSLLEKVGSLKQVESYYYSGVSELYTKDLIKYYPEKYPFALAEPSGSWNRINLRGLWDEEFFEKEYGLITIVDGRSITDEEINSGNNAVVISQNLAKVNNLSIGSKFSLASVVWDMGKSDVTDSSFFVDENILALESYSFEVVGLFRTNITYDTGSEMFDEELLCRLENRVFLSHSYVTAAERFYFDEMSRIEPDEQVWRIDASENILLENIFILSDSSDMKSFSDAAKTILPEFYTVTSATEAFSATSETLTKTLSTWERIAVAALCIGVLSLTAFSVFVIFFQRKRHRDYLNCSGKKTRAYSQVLFTITMICILAMIASVFPGFYLAHEASERMLVKNRAIYEKDNETKSFSTIDYMGFSNNASADDMMDYFRISHTSRTLASEFSLLVGCIVVVFAPFALYIFSGDHKKHRSESELFD